MEEITIEILHSDLQAIYSCLTSLVVYTWGLLAWSIISKFRAKNDKR